MRRHITKKKTHFSVSIIALIAVIIVGSFILDKTQVFSFDYIRQELSYLKYKKAIEGELNNEEVLVKATEIPVLVYHGITDKSERFSMSQEQFADQMITLKKAGFSTITLEDLDNFLNNGKELPKKSFVLTFDDARQDSYTGSDSILKALDYSAVMFVPTANIFSKGDAGGGYYLNRNQLQKMVSSGRWELGSHALQQTGDSVPIDKKGARANFLSNKMWLKDLDRLETDVEYETRVAKELKESKMDLEEAFGVSVSSFAYPSSDYGQQSTNNGEKAEEVIKKHVEGNYKMAFQQISVTDNKFTLNYPGDNLIFLHRIEPDKSWGGQKLSEIIGSAQSKDLSGETIDVSENVWKKIWGTIIQNKDSITLTSTLEKSGSGAFLDGTKVLDNFYYQTKVRGDDVESISLYARYQDENNSYSCTFTDSYVKISEKIDGQIKMLNEIRYDNFEFNGQILGISITDRKIVCFKNESPLMMSNHDNKIKNGGIGLSIWDSVFKNRNVVFSDFSIKEIIPK